MLISTCGAEKSIAAANMLTLIVLPKRRGVLTSTSCDMCVQLLRCRISKCCLANVPGGSSFQKMRVHALRKSSWNRRWW
jgi:hypothetical protein